MEIGQPVRKVFVVPLRNPVPVTAPEGPRRSEPVPEPVPTPERVTP